jgi:simple sugar transport system ATP-binding protein
MRGITKTYSGLYAPVVANHRVDLAVAAGEFHVIVGENGAGKSTLMKILYGLEQPDAGTIRLFGESVVIASPAAAIAAGVGMIHQHFMLVPSFTVAENIVLGKEPTRATLLDRKRIRNRLERLNADLKLTLDLDARIEDIALGAQQRVEILKALYRGARVLILDEPTAVLTPQEVDILFAALARLRAAGTTIIMITHKLPEVMAVADRVTVMRDGMVVDCLPRAELDERRLADLMTGRPWSPDRLARAASSTREPILEVSELSCTDDRGLPAVRGASFVAYGGEILAIAGVAHNGQDELAEAIMGQRPLIAGRIALRGKDVTGANVRTVRAAGAGHVPDDRYREGSAPLAGVAKNMIMTAHRSAPLSRAGSLRRSAIRDWVDRLIAAYGVKAPHRDAPIGSLSGGNMQKAIVAREIAVTGCCLVAEQPSRGVDIGAAESIYAQLMQLRARGVAILLISMDLTETLRLADRVLVIYGGQIVGERRPEATSPRELGRLMTGAVSNGAA